MSQQYKKDCGDYLIHLLKCALSSEMPDEKPDNVSWKEVLLLAKYHNTANTACYAVERLESKPDDVIFSEWKEIKNKALVRDITQRSELKKLSDVFEKSEIKMMAVKGCRMKQLYPRTDMRFMSDLDIIVESNSIPNVCNILQGLGYKSEKHNLSHHIEFNKPPVMHVEIHNALISEQWKSFRKYYSDPFKCGRPQKEKRFVYEMTDEEFYIYFLVHLYKHYSNGGTGIRSVMDCFMLNKNLSSKLDWTYINKKLEQLELIKLKDDFDKLANFWFASGNGSKVLESMGDYIISSGTYGTIHNYVQNGIKSQGRFRYLIGRIFPPYSLMKSLYPVLEHLPFLLPFFWIWKDIKALFSSKSTSKRQIKMMFKNK